MATATDLERRVGSGLVHKILFAGRVGPGPPWIGWVFKSGPVDNSGRPNRCCIEARNGKLQNCT